MKTYKICWTTIDNKTQTHLYCNSLIEAEDDLEAVDIWARQLEEDGFYNGEIYSVRQLAND